MKQNTIALLTASAMTGTTTVNSAAIPVDQLWGFAIQAVWTGTPNGTIKLQASCDAPTSTTQTSSGTSAVVNWTDIADSSVTIAGSAGNYMWNISSAAYRFVRVTYTNTSSTGVLSATMSAKGV